MWTDSNAGHSINVEKLGGIINEIAGISGVSLTVLDADRKVLVDAGRKTQNDGRTKDRTTVTPDETGQPVTLNDRIIGWVVSNDPNGNKDEHGETTAKLVSEIITCEAGKEAELNDLSVELLEKYEEINLLYDFGESLGTLFDAEAVHRIVLERGTELTLSQKAIILTPDVNTGEMNVTAFRGIEKKDTESFIAVSRAAANLVLLEGKPMLLKNAEQITKQPVADTSIYGDCDIFPLICVPMNVKENNLGVIIIWDRQPDGMFTASDLKLLSTMTSQAAISLYNSRLIDKLKESERMKRDMEIASRIQLSLLPAKAPDINGLDLAGKCVPALNAGGDYYDYLPLSADELGIVIADVSGHNIVATLGVAATRGVLRSEMMRSHSTAEVLEHTNCLIYDDLTTAELFISAFYAIFNCRTGKLTYTNGGHNLPFVYHASSNDCTAIDTDGLLLGILEKVDFEERSMTVGTGDILVLYTDGITEAVNQEQFGEEKLQRIVAENHDQSAHEIIDEVFRQVYRHSTGITQYDDITMVVMKVTGNGSDAGRFPVN
jgi:phosphoserine phosphatase RsbU/P